MKPTDESSANYLPVDFTSQKNFTTKLVKKARYMPELTVLIEEHELIHEKAVLIEEHKLIPEKPVKRQSLLLKSLNI